MYSTHLKRDILLLFLLAFIAVGIPVAIRTYDRVVWQQKIPKKAKIITLTGHMDKGWIVGNVRAFEVLSFRGGNLALQHPVIKVSKGDLVSFKLTSSDVIHGFSLKEFGIFIDKGLPPGKVTIVTFKADKVGSFTFSCNAICGHKHENMKGTLVVTA